MGILSALFGLPDEKRLQRIREKKMQDLEFKVVKIKGKQLYLRKVRDYEKELARYHDNDTGEYVPCTEYEADILFHQLGRDDLTFNQKRNEDLYIRYLETIRSGEYAQHRKQQMKYQKQQEKEERKRERRGRLRRCKDSIDIDSAHPIGYDKYKDPHGYASADQQLARYHDWNVPKIDD